MRKKIIFCSLLTSIFSFGQHFCGFEERQKELDKQFPENKIKREAINKEFQEKGVAGILKEYGFGNDFSIGEGLREMNNSINLVSSAYQGEVYNIPIVIHVIESDDKDNADLKLTDEEIIRWVNDTNAMYATTYGNGFFAEGDGPDGGAVIPFRLVLAKRDPNCQPTTGIIRYDAKNIAGYSQYGMKNGANGKGANGGDIKRLAPHWPETAYYNVYIITAFNGEKRYGGLLGWATGPDAGFSSYETMMKASVVKRHGDTTLAHEFGHSLGLAHPFNGVPYDSGQCPSNADCTRDNDKVCDTEPTQSLIGKAPTNNDINPCTNVNYQGGQYNIMNYSTRPRKFTPGQRERTLALFLSQKGILTRSLGATPPNANSSRVDLIPTTCSVPGIDNPNNRMDVGVIGVSIGSINNQSDASGSKFYTDYSLNNCTIANYTDIQEGEEASLTLSKATTNGFVLQAWIDYNDNGIFEDNEKLFRRDVNDKKVSSVTHKFIPPDTAVKDKYIRMRVKGDWWHPQNLNNPCGQLVYGDVEDYAIRIVSKKKQADPTYDGRVGINTDEPMATLDVRETNIDLLPQGTPQGVLFPKFTTQERDTFQNVKEGTMIYNTTLKCLEIYKGNSWGCFQH